MDVRIPTGDGTISGYLARPQVEVSGQAPWPAVVVLHDAFGVTQDARDITDRFATAGYLALAPDLFSRGGWVRCIRTVFRELVAARGRAFDDIDAARRILAADAGCTGGVGVVGFCMGGGFALAAASAGFDVSAPYYGQLPADLSVLDGACPIVASFGGRDPSLKGASDTLKVALNERRITHDVKEYPEAGHGFANELPLGPFNKLAKFAGFGYDHDASENAWRRVQSFFSQQLR